MRSASIADWILRRVVDKERATSMVGDLVEISRQKGMVWFWLSVMGVVVARVWRPMLGVTLVAYSGLWVSVQIFRILFGFPEGHFSGHYPPDFWRPLLEAAGFVGGFLGLAAAYSAIRFGVRDRFAQTVFAVAALCLGLIYGWWQPVVILVCCIAACVGLLAVCVISRQRRRALLTLPIIFATGYLGVHLAGFLNWVYVQSAVTLFGPYSATGQRGYNEHPNMVWMGALRWHNIPINGRPSEFWIGFWGSQVIYALAIAAACEVMHWWSMSNSKKGSALENGEALPGIS
jgi:hypothetical protein